VNKDWENIWNELIIAEFEVLPSISLEGLRKNTIILRLFFCSERKFKLGDPRMGSMTPAHSTVRLRNDDDRFEFHVNLRLY
jgi:hypothetical protein